MRLPWPFGRSTAAPAETTPDSPAPVAPEAPARPRSTGAWAALPPIQRAVGAAPLVASSAAFLEGVPGVQPLPPIVEPLGHDVTQVAPAGLVAAPVHAVSSLTSSAALVPPRVQRRTEASGQGTASGPAAQGAAFDAPSPAAADAPSSVSAASVGVSAETVPVDPPARQLGVVTPAATVQPPDRPLTRANPPSAPPDRTDRPLVGRRTQVQTTQATAPLSTSSGSGASSSPSKAQPTPPDSRAGQAATSTTAGRRSGLGVPLPEAPATAVPVTGRPLPGLGLSRLAANLPAPAAPAGSRTTVSAPQAAAPVGGDAARISPTAGAAPLRTTIQRRTNGSRSAQSRPEAEEPVASEGDPAGPAAGPAATSTPDPAPRHAASLPVLRVVAQSGAAGATEAAVTASAPGGGGSPTSTAGRTGSAESAPRSTVARSVAAEPLVPPPAARPQRRPLAGSQQIGQVGAVQRQATPDAAPSRAGGVSAGSDSGSTTSWLAPDVFAGSGLDASTGQTWTLPGWEPSGPASKHVPGVQRAAASDWPAPIGPGADLRTAPAFSRRPDDARGQSTTLALARPAALPPAPRADTGGGAPPTVARSIESDAGAPQVQTITASPPVQGPVFGPTATPVVQRIDGSPPPAPEPRGSSEHSDEELDELARSLFSRLRNRLRNEYIYEREAKGLTFDQS